MHLYKKIFVAVDGSELQEKVLVNAIEIAARNHATLRVGHVINSSLLEAAGTYPSDIAEQMKDHAIEDISKIIEATPDAAHVPDIEIAIEVGQLRETLLNTLAADYEPELIVCGARGLSMLKYALLGSVSAFIVNNAPCDVLVVR